MSVQHEGGDEMIGFEWSIADIFLVLILCLIYVRVKQVEGRLAGILRLDAKIDALLSSSGVQFDFQTNLPDGVAQALESGEKIQAIKHYRRATGAGLEEAKEFIEFIQRREKEGA
jgi:hypothetical protein